MLADSRKGNGIVFILFLVILSFVYSPLVTSYFAAFDDWYFFEWRGMRTHGSFELGRPLQAIMMDLVYAPLIHTVEDANLARFVSILTLSFTAFAMYVFFKRYVKNDVQMFLLSLIIVTLPPFHNYVSFLVAGPYAFGCLLSVCSALMALKAIESHSALRNKITDASISIILLIMGIGTYQPCGMLFSSMLVFWLLNKDVAHVNWKRVGGFFAILFGSLLSYLALWRCWLNHENAGIQLWGPHTYDGRVLENDFDKMYWFCDPIMIKALHLWDVVWSGKIDITVLVVLSIIVAGPVVELINIIKSGGTARYKLVPSFVLKYVLIIVLLPISSIPILASKTNIDKYGVLPALMTSLLILLYMGIKGIVNLSTMKWKAKIVTVVLSIMCVHSSFEANRNVMRYFALPSAIELGYARGEISRYISIYNRIPKAITVVMSSRSVVVANSKYETGAPSITDADPLRAGIIIRQMLRELGIDPIKNAIKVTHIPASESNTGHKEEEYRQGAIAAISVDSANIGFGAENIYDQDTYATFWEISKPFPHWIQFDFGENVKREVKKYILYTGGHGPGREPKTWQFQGCDDGITWVALDARGNECNWEKNEKRTYNINNHTSYRYYRLYITAGMEPGILRLYGMEIIGPEPLGPESGELIIDMTRVYF